MNGILFKPDVWKAKLRVLEECGEAQTRRIIKIDQFGWIYKGILYGIAQFDHKATNERIIIRPRYQAGEVVYIKEVWWTTEPTEGFVYFKADWDSGLPCEMLNENGKWKSPLFMPAWAARYFIQITDVRAERLQEITDSDAIQEGVIFMGGIADNFDEAPWCASIADQEPVKYPKTAYARLWDSINKKNLWESNPWVWVYKFELAIK